MNTTCASGQITEVEIAVPDCECGVGLQRAYFTTNSATGTVTLSIVLTNGQNITSGPLNSTVAPTVQFRVQGNTLQYSINNGQTWVNIYTFTFNQANTTPGTTSTTSQQILNAISVPGGTILNPGDNLNIKTVNIGNAVGGNPVSNGQLAGVTVFGTSIPNIPLANGAAKTTINLKATMALNGSGQTVFVINGEAVMSAAPSGNGLETVLGSFTIPQFSTGVIDFTSNQQIQATGTSVNAGDLTEQFLSVALAKQTLNVIPVPSP